MSLRKKTNGKKGLDLSAEIARFNYNLKNKESYKSTFQLIKKLSKAKAGFVEDFNKELQAHQEQYPIILKEKYDLLSRNDEKNVTPIDSSSEIIIDNVNVNNLPNFSNEITLNCKLKQGAEELSYQFKMTLSYGGERPRLNMQESKAQAAEKFEFYKLDNITASLKKDSRSKSLVSSIFGNSIMDSLLNGSKKTENTVKLIMFNDHLSKAGLGLASKEIESKANDIIRIGNAEKSVLGAGKFGSLEIFDTTKSMDAVALTLAYSRSEKKEAYLVMDKNTEKSFFGNSTGIALMGEEYGPNAGRMLSEDSLKQLKKMSENEREELLGEVFKSKFLRACLKGDQDLIEKLSKKAGSRHEQEKVYDLMSAMGDKKCAVLAEAMESLESVNPLYPETSKRLREGISKAENEGIWTSELKSLILTKGSLNRSLSGLTNESRNRDIKENEREM